LNGLALSPHFQISEFPESGGIENIKKGTSGKWLRGVSTLRRLLPKVLLWD